MGIVDYLYEHLDYSNKAVYRGERIANEKIDYIVVNDNSRKKIVLPIRRRLSRDRLKKVLSAVCRNFSDVVVVFLKDGKNYFRSAAEKAHSKAERSLKRYSTRERNLIIELTPAERVLLGSRRNWIQYYQPSSERLEEGIETILFGNVVFDYTHTFRGRSTPLDTYGPSKDSETLFKIERRFHSTPPFVIERNFLYGERREVDL